MNSSARSSNSFGTYADLLVGVGPLSVYRLDKLAGEGFDVSRLPFSLKILLENLLRHEDGLNVTPESIAALASWATPRQGRQGRGASGRRSRSPRPGS